MASVQKAALHAAAALLLLLAGGLLFVVAYRAQAPGMLLGVAACVAIAFVSMVRATAGFHSALRLASMPAGTAKALLACGGAAAVGVVGLTMGRAVQGDVAAVWQGLLWLLPAVLLGGLGWRRLAAEGS